MNEWLWIFFCGVSYLAAIGVLVLFVKSATRDKRLG